MKILYTQYRSLITKHFFTGKSLFLAVLLISFSALNAQNALDFDGSAAVNTNYVKLPTMISSGSYTKEAWVMRRALSGGGQNIISGNNSALWVNGNQLSAGHNGTYTSVYDINQINPNTWYHIALTYNAGTQEMILYVNGAQATNGVATVPNMVNDSVLLIGGYKYDASNVAYQWDGLIDEVRIWNVVRTPTEIANSYNCILSGDETGLLAYYRFNQGTAGGNNTGLTTLLDESDRCVANNGTLIGFTLNGATSNWVAESPFGGHGTTSPCGLNFPNISLSGNSTCITSGDVTPSLADHTDFGTGVSITRTFTIQNTGGSDLSVTAINISGPNAAEFAVQNGPSLPATITAGNSVTFEILFTPSSVGPKSATVTVTNNDGDEGTFTYDLAVYSILPVTYKSFTIKKEAGQSRLYWATATEVNNIGFNIERSADGLTWISIGFVAGSGNSDIERNYSFVDFQPVKGVNYYRLKQVDIDNRSRYSDTRMLTFASNKTLVYPVPTRDIVIVELADNRLVGTNALLSDMQGKVVRQFTINSIQQSVSLSDLQAGMYWLKTADGVTHKLIKQ